MNLPLLCLAGLAIIVIIVVMAWHRNNASWGFKDIVKNPQYWEELSKANEDLEAGTQAAKLWTDDKVASFTKNFVLKSTAGSDSSDDMHILRSLGERTHPVVLELLGDASLYKVLVKPTATNVLPEAPLNRACDLLGDSPPPAAVQLLAPFLNDPSEEIRKDAALAIAKTGDAAISPLVKKAFSDSDEYVRSYALMGLDFALNRSALADSAQAELFPDVLALLQTGKNADKAAKILHRLDEAKATAFFLSPEVFNANSPILHEVLRTMADAKSPVPRENLRKLISSLETMEMEYPADYALAEALRLLGQRRNDEDRDFLRSRTTHPVEKVAEGASAGLLASFGLEDFQKRIWESEGNSNSLSANQLLCSAVLMCDAEINNGGFSQYFVNSSGDNWKNAVAGFKAMGFSERLRLLEEAVAAFGPDGPSVDRSARQDQLATLFQRDDEVFETLEKKYYDSPESVEALCARYVLEHPEDFR